MEWRGRGEEQSLLRDSRKVWEETNLLWPSIKSEQSAGELGMGRVTEVQVTIALPQSPISSG